MFVQKNSKGLIVLAQLFWYQRTSTYWYINPYSVIVTQLGDDTLGWVLFSLISHARKGSTMYEFVHTFILYFEAGKCKKNEQKRLFQSKDMKFSYCISKLKNSIDSDNNMKNISQRDSVATTLTPWKFGKSSIIISKDCLSGFGGLNGNKTGINRLKPKQGEFHGKIWWLYRNGLYRQYFPTLTPCFYSLVTLNTSPIMII
jgi:hypothetical protein